MTPGDIPPGPPPDGLADHADLDTLADLDAGVLDAATAARIDAHASTCPSCLSTLSALTAVRRDLRSLPPPPLPADIASRLDATLADLRRGRAGPPLELTGVLANGAAAGADPASSGDPTDSDPAGSDLTGPASGTPEGEAEVVDLAASRQRRAARSHRLSSWVAASVVVTAALVGVGTAMLQHDENRGTLSRGDMAGAGSGGSGSDQYNSPNGNVRPKTAAGAREPAPSTAATAALPRYTKAGLLSSIADILKDAPAGSLNSSLPAAAAGDLAARGRRSQCLSDLGRQTGTLVAVQHALFEGDEGYVLVFSAGATSRRVVVVGGSCGLSTPVQVLFQTP